jgi:hypothetical protein
MSNTITIDLDSLSEDQAQKLAGFILTYAGSDEPQSLHNLEFEDAVERAAEAAHSVAEPSPSQVFGKPHPDHPAINTQAPSVYQQIAALDAAPSTISTAGPTLVIPNPPSGAAAQVATPPTTSFTPTAVSGMVVDKTGLPWDSRIHSAAKSFNADGTWRARRGLVDGYSNQIECELRQVMAIPSPSTPAMAATAPVAQAAVATSANIPAPPPAIQPYLDLMNKVSSALAGARITQVQLQKVCDAVGLPNFVSLGTRLDLVPTVAPMIDGILAGAAV